MTRLVWLAASCVGVLLLSGCPASDDGTALLRNTTGTDDLTVVVQTLDGRTQEGGRLEQAYRFDVQWTDRERQCYVAEDGFFEVLRVDGTVLAHHDFADRELCEREEVTLAPDGTLTWVE